MAGLYEIWRDPTKDEDDPDRFRWTCTVLTTEAEDDARPHPRPDAADGRARTAGRSLARPARPGKDDLLDLLVPAAPGRLEAYPVSTLVSNVRNNGPELVEPLPLDESPSMTREPSDRRRSPPRTARRGWSPHRARQPGRHAAAQPRRGQRHRHPRPRGAGPAPARATASPWCCSSSRGGSPAARIATAAGDPRRRRCVAAADRCAIRTPLVVGGRSAGARSAARCAPSLGAVGLPGAVLPAAPAGPPGEVPARGAARRPACRRWCPGRARHDGPARGVPATDVDLAVVPGADHGFKVPVARRSARTRRWGSWSRRPWSGSCARSSAATGMRSPG